MCCLRCIAIHFVFQLFELQLPSRVIFFETFPHTGNERKVSFVDSYWFIEKSGLNWLSSPLDLFVEIMRRFKVGACYGGGYTRLPALPRS